MPSSTKYQIEIHRRAERVLRRLPQDLRQRLDEAILALGANPRPRGCVPLSGLSGEYRIRIGDWRIIYQIQDDRLIILILEVGPRGGVYRSR